MVARLRGAYPDLGGEVLSEQHFATKIGQV
jgi:hypothetical protein